MKEITLFPHHLSRSLTFCQLVKVSSQTIKQTYNKNYNLSRDNLSVQKKPDNKIFAGLKIRIRDDRV